MRRVSADRSTFGLDGPIVEAAPREDPAVGLVHLFVGIVELIEVGAETVGILHLEFAGPHYAETRAFLIPKFRLDLEDGDRQLLVAFDLPRHQVRDDLLMCRAKNDLDLPVAADEREVDQGVAIVVDPAGLFPQLGRAQCWHEQFNCTGSFHFLADDRFDFSHRSPTQWQVGVGTGHHLADQAGTEHQLVAGDLGIGRDFLHRRNKRLAPAHA